MELSWSRLPLKLAGSFRTSKSRRGDKETLWVKINHANIVGFGEAAPVDTYHQTLESAERTLYDIRPLVADYDPIDLERVLSLLVRQFPDQMATVAALDAALHDWLGKKWGMS